MNHLQRVIAQNHERLAAMAFRFVAKTGDTWRWKIHRQEKGGFRTEKAAATSLASALNLADVNQLKVDFGPVPRPDLPARMQGFSLCWHAQKLGWFAKDNRKYFLHPAEAIKASGLVKRSIQKRAPAAEPGPLRLYTGVTFSKAKGAWICQIVEDGRAKQVCGLHPTQKAAATALAEHKGVPVESLKKNATVAFQRRADTIAHFKALCGIYGAVGHMKRLPGDLQDLLRYAKSDGKFCLAMQTFIIQLKYAPYRDIVRKHGKRYEVAQKSGVKVQWAPLVAKLVSEMEKLPEASLDPWRASVGKNVSHHHGGLAFLQQMRAIKKIGTKKASKDPVSQSVDLLAA